MMASSAFSDTAQIAGMNVLALAPAELADENKDAYFIVSNLATVSDALNVTCINRMQAAIQDSEAQTALISTVRSAGILLSFSHDAGFCHHNIRHSWHDHVYGCSGCSCCECAWLWWAVASLCLSCR